MNSKTIASYGAVDLSSSPVLHYYSASEALRRKRDISRSPLYSSVITLRLASSSIVTSPAGSSADAIHSSHFVTLAWSPYSIIERQLWPTESMEKKWLHGL